MAAPERIVYNGVTYHRYPDSKHAFSRRYFSSGRETLHRQVWRDAYGEIPVGFDVHHRDGNTLNNALENLELLSKSAHRSEHISDAILRQLDAVRPSAVEASLTDEARARRSAGIRRAWLRREPVRLVCARCGGVFEALNGYARYCSARCNTAVWRTRDTSKKREAKCELCGTLFKSERVRRFCGTVCRNRAIAAGRRKE